MLQNNVIRKIPYILGKAGSAVLDIIFPGACALCHRELENSSDVLCPYCWQELQDCMTANTCPVCGHSMGAYALIDGKCLLCQNKRPTITRIMRTGSYSGALRELVLLFKFQGKSHLDTFLGGMMANAILGAGRDICNDIDYLVPIPLHWRRYWHRGYNQSELLARIIARHMQRQGYRIKPNTDLVRIKHTPPQSTLRRSERLRNIKGAFDLRRGHNFTGKHICLIDDVTTTGTTLRVAANIIKKAGARKISAAVLAVADSNDDSVSFLQW